MNAPAIYQGDLIPFAELKQMALAVAKSGLFGMKTEDQALALMLTAQAEGQHPATITQDYDIIQGRATRKTNSVLARFQAAGGKVDWHELTAKRAAATFTPPPSAGGPLEMEWTIEMAKAITSWSKEKEKYLPLTDKDNWKNYPRAMLRARCIAEGVRATYPAAIGGYLVPEEAQDLDAIPGEVVGKTVTVVEQPKAKTESAAPASAPASTSQENPQAGNGGAAPDLMKPSQVRIIKAKLESAALTVLDLELGFPGKSLEPKEGKELFAFAQWAEVVSWIEKNAKG